MTRSPQLRPTHIRLETATVCQLRCPTCPTTEGEVARGLGAGFLRFEKFRTFLEENPRIRSLELSNWGEMFLNPDIVKIMEFAHTRGVELHADNGVNLNNAKPEALEAAVRFGFRSMTCSIDGATQETYVQYRRRGNFETVIGNIRRINEFKRAHNSPHPALKWQFVVFGHNEHEIPMAKEMARELGMEIQFKLSWDGTGDPKDAYSPVRDEAWVREQTGLGYASRREYADETGRAYLGDKICGQIWRTPQVNWDGRMLGCCVNTWGDFGNVFERPLDEVMNGDRMDHARRMLTGSAPEREDIPCTTCSHYRRMKETGAWLDGDALAAPVAEGGAPPLRRMLRNPGRALAELARRVHGRIFTRTG